jgi:hypothetical protein
VFHQAAIYRCFSTIFLHFLTFSIFHAMKKAKFLFLCITVFTALFMQSCQKEQLPNSESTEMLSEGGATDRSVNPTITSITSSFNPWLNGGKGFGNWTGHWAVNHGQTQTVFTLNGSGFSTNPTITLLNAPNYSLSIVSKSNTQIKVRVTPTSTGAQAVSASIKVQNGTLSTTHALPMVPHVYTRQFRQCTWWASVRRIDVGKTPQVEGQSYSQFSGSMDANYIPTAGDVLAWYKSAAAGHQGYLESVNTVQTFNPPGTPSGTIDYTYTMNISQYNIIPEAFSSYQRVVKVRKAPNGTRTIISGTYGNPSTSTYSTWKYFR